LLKLYFRHFAFDLDKKRPIIGSKWIDRYFQANFQRIKEGKLFLLLGETGVPFDLSGCQSDHSDLCEEALDRTLRNIETSQIDFVLWNYCYDSDFIDGDHWNGESLSIRVNDGMKLRNRGVTVAVRPYVFEHSSDIEILEQTFIRHANHGYKTASQYKLKVQCRRVSLISGIHDTFIFIYFPSVHFVSDERIFHELNVSSGYISNYNRLSQTLHWRGLDCSEKGDEPFELSIFM
jgi:hypothetical protein